MDVEVQSRWTHILWLIRLLFLLLQFTNITKLYCVLAALFSRFASIRNTLQYLRLPYPPSSRHFNRTTVLRAPPRPPIIVSEFRSASVASMSLEMAWDERHPPSSFPISLLMDEPSDSGRGPAGFSARRLETPLGVASSMLLRISSYGSLSRLF